MYQTDILELASILTGLGYRDERMQEAIDKIVAKQDDRGRWKLENTFNGRTPIAIEGKLKPSKWITLNALRVLKNYYRQTLDVILDALIEVVELVGLDPFAVEG
jgi:hypothetical protein